MLSLCVDSHSRFVVSSQRMSKRKAARTTAAASDSALKKPKPSTNNSPEVDAECKRLFYNSFAVDDCPSDEGLPYTSHEQIFLRHRCVVRDVTSNDSVLAQMGKVFQSIDVVKIILAYTDDTPVEWKYFGGALFGRLFSVRLLLDQVDSRRFPVASLQEKPRRELALSVHKEQGLDVVCDLIGAIFHRVTNCGTPQTAASVIDLRSQIESSRKLTAEIHRAQGTINKVVLHTMSSGWMDYQMYFLVSSGSDVVACARKPGCGPLVALRPFGLKLKSVEDQHEDYTGALQFNEAEVSLVEAAFEKTDSVDSVAAELAEQLAVRFREINSDSIWYKLILVARVFPDPYSIVR
jgi:hypothetical protein